MMKFLLDTLYWALLLFPSKAREIRDYVVENEKFLMCYCFFMAFVFFWWHPNMRIQQFLPPFGLLIFGGLLGSHVGIPFKMVLMGGMICVVIWTMYKVES